MIKNIIQTLFTKGFVAVINFIILIVSSKFLGISTRGEISLFILNIANIQIINEVFTGYTLVYFVPKFNLKKIFVYGVVWTLAATTLSNLAIFLLDKEIAGYEIDLFFLSILIILNTFNLVILLAKENIRLYNFLSVSQPFILLAGLAFSTLVLKEFTFRAYVYPLYISFGVSFIISTIAVLKHVSLLTLKTDFSLKDILKNGFYCQVAVLLHLLSNRLSFYILASSALIGLYSTASSLMESVWIIANGISPIVLSKISNSGDSSFNRSLVFTLAKASLLLSCLAVLVISFLPNQLFIYLLGNDFSEAKSIMLWIAPGILTISFSSVLIHYFSGLGNLKLIAICNLIGFVFTLIFAPFLIRKYSLHGAALTANISYFISALILFIVFLKKSQFKSGEVFNLKTDVRNLREAFHS
jgi:O-antigen/teichoic acid export membrane protein